MHTSLCHVSSSEGAGLRKSLNDAICGIGTTQRILKDLQRVRVNKLEPRHSSLEVVLVQSDKDGDGNDHLHKAKSYPDNDHSSVNSL